MKTYFSGGVDVTPVIHIRSEKREKWERERKSENGGDKGQGERAKE